MRRYDAAENNDGSIAERILPGFSLDAIGPVSYTHLTLPTTLHECRSRWSPYH